MRTNRALIRKEVQVMGKKLFIPVWIMGAIYGMILLGIIISLFLQQGKLVTIENEPMTLEEAIRLLEPFELADYNRQISYITNYFLAMMISALLILNLSLTTVNVLNVNHRDNFELFHRAQPVSFLRIAATKLSAIVGSNWVIYVGLCILNFLIINIFVSIQLRNIMSWNFWYAFIGMIHWILPVLLISAILTAFAFLISAIFQDATNVKAVGTVLGLWIIILIFNRMFGWNIPSPFSYFLSVFDIGIGSFSRLAANDTEFNLPNWSFFLNWKTLIHVVVGGVFFSLGTLIYSKREIKQ